MEITSPQPIQISPCRTDFYTNSTRKSLIRTSPHPRLDSCIHQRKNLRLGTVRKSSNPGTSKINSAHRLRPSCVYDKMLPLFQPSAKQSSSARASSWQRKSSSTTDICCCKSAPPVSSLCHIPQPAFPPEDCAGAPTSNDCSHFSPAACSYSAMIPRMSPAAIRSISMSQQSALSSAASPLAYRLLYGSWEDDLPFIDLDEAK